MTSLPRSTVTTTGVLSMLYFSNISANSLGAGGRSPGPRWGPREIDIDILRYQGLQVDEPGLTIPHPEIGHRPFLRRLLAEIGAP